jgi:hypothetical protein
VLVIMAQLGPVTCHHNRDLLVSIRASPAIHGIIAFHSCKVVSKVVDDAARRKSIALVKSGNSDAFSRYSRVGI